MLGFGAEGPWINPWERHPFCEGGNPEIDEEAWGEDDDDDGESETKM